MNSFFMCVWFILVPLLLGENAVTHADEAHRNLAEEISGQSFKKIKKTLVDSFYSNPYASPVYNGGSSQLSRRIHSGGSTTYGNGSNSYPLARPIRNDIYQDEYYPVSPPINSYYGNPARPYPGSSSSYHGGFGAHEICCADCPRGDIRCLAKCVRVGCNSTPTCAAAGDGAYAAFCQRRCSTMAGMSVGFLPDPACRGLCASEVQRLCYARACKDYGCYAPECEQVAPAGCDF